MLAEEIESKEQSDLDHEEIRSAIFNQNQLVCENVKNMLLKMSAGSS